MHFYSIRKYRTPASPFKAVQHVVESCPDMYMSHPKKPTKYLNLYINITKIHKKEQQAKSTSYLHYMYLHVMGN